MLIVNNVQCHPPLLHIIPRKPKSETPTSTELVHDFVTPVMVPIAQVDRMEAPRLVFLHVFLSPTPSGSENLFFLFKF